MHFLVALLEVIYVFEWRLNGLALMPQHNLGKQVHCGEDGLVVGGL